MMKLKGFDTSVVTASNALSAEGLYEAELNLSSPAVYMVGVLTLRGTEPMIGLVIT